MAYGSVVCISCGSTYISPKVGGCDQREGGACGDVECPGFHLECLLHIFNFVKVYHAMLVI